MGLTLQMDQEDDGRRIAEVPELPGVLVYGKTQDDAILRVKALSLRMLADHIDHGESLPPTILIASSPSAHMDRQEQCDENS
jgi:predicted RNase H-like HicB family nuclease